MLETDPFAAINPDIATIFQSPHGSDFGVGLGVVALLLGVNGFTSNRKFVHTNGKIECKANRGKQI